MGAFELRFYGCRGSFSLPLNPTTVESLSRSVWQRAQENPKLSWEDYIKDASRQRSQYSTYGQNTSCVEVSSLDLPMPLYLDAGSGLTEAARDSQSKLYNAKEVAIFFSHTHWDHVCALPTIPQLFSGKTHFHFYGVHEDLKERVALLFTQSHFPVPFESISKNISFHSLSTNQIFKVGQCEVQSFKQSHPGDSYAYRFTSPSGASFVYASDTDLKGLGANEIFYANADMLIVDAHFSKSDYKRGFGHASVEEAIDFALLHKSKLLCLYHLNPEYSDTELEVYFNKALEYLRQRDKENSLKVILPHEGQRICVENT